MALLAEWFTGKRNQRRSQGVQQGVKDPQVDYANLDKAVGQWSEQDVRNLAERSP
jgi:hypothetical protein